MKELKRLRNQPFIISPPFGTYFRHKYAKSVLGSLTLHARPGKWLKILQFLYDNWRYPVEDGWRNRIELKNNGVTSIECYTDEYIYSLVGLEDLDWEAMAHVIHDRRFHHGRPMMELNGGCRNVHDYSITLKAIRAYTQFYDTIIKLPADKEEALRLADLGAQGGVMFFHAGNTVPDSIGSLSGYPAKRVNLPIVEELAKRYDIPIIGGSGIYKMQDITDYENAGAVRFALGTIWMNWFRARALINEYMEKKHGISYQA